MSDENDEQGNDRNVHDFGLVTTNPGCIHLSTGEVLGGERDGEQMVILEITFPPDPDSEDEEFILPWVLNRSAARTARDLLTKWLNSTKRSQN